MANEVLPHEKNGKIDYSRINIDVGDHKIFKFKAANDNEGLFFFF
jgi:hypothetical protein